MINCALKIKFPFTQNKKRTRAHFVYLFLVPVRGAFSTLFFWLLFTLTNLYMKPRKTSDIFAFPGGHMFLCSVFLITKQKNDEKQNAYFCSIFFICKNYLVLWMASLESIIMCFSFSIENSKPRSKITNK